MNMPVEDKLIDILKIDKDTWESYIDYKLMGIYSRIEGASNMEEMFSAQGALRILKDLRAITRGL